MPRSTSVHVLVALALAGLGSACALPHGSMARPVRPATDGEVLLAGGAMVPFAAAGGATVGDDSAFGSATADEVFVIPHASFDYALGSAESGNPRHYIGVDVSVWSQAFATGGDNFDALAVFVNPRWEYGVSDYFSLTVDGNLGVLTDDDTTLPFISPTFGVRAYVPTGWGGLVLSQQIGTAFITVTTPGSAAYDMPIPLGDATLHIFPEVRWDPTFFFVGDDSGVLAFFSGGLSFMLRI